MKQLREYVFLSSIKMKMDGVVVAVAVAVAMMALSGNGPHGAEAQMITCQTVPHAFAPVTDANTLVEEVRGYTWECCHTGKTYCTVLSTFGDSAVTLCGSEDYCLPCSDVGNDVNLVLAQCVVDFDNIAWVQGVYTPDGVKTFYLSSSSYLT